MSESKESKPSPPADHRITPLSAAVLGLLGIAVFGAVVALPTPSGAAPTPPPATTTPNAAFRASAALPPTAQGGQLVQREAVAITTPLPTLTPYLTPTIAPVTPIPWTEEDVNALTWLCYEEVRGMREARIDACLSVISTVRRRYAYEDDPYHESTIAGTLLRENQFPIDFELDRPAPDDELVSAVDNYQWGARGSCTGYLYYDSVPGGPSLCVIRAANNQFVEFHNGWR